MSHYDDHDSRDDRGYGGHRGGHRGGHHGGHHRGGHGGNRGGHRGGHGGGHGHGGSGRRGLPLSELDPALTEVSRKVIGCAIEVHKELGPGYPREIYFKALEMELDAEEIDFKANHAIDVEFDEEVIGQVHADLFIDERFLLTVLARTGDVGGEERSNLRARLRSADLELGLIINFGERRLKDGLVRVLNPDKLNLNARDDEEFESDDAEDEAGETPSESASAEG